MLFFNDGVSFESFGLVFFFLFTTSDAERSTFVSPEAAICGLKASVGLAEEKPARWTASVELVHSELRLAKEKAPRIERLFSGSY